MTPSAYIPSNVKNVKNIPEFLTYVEYFGISVRFLTYFRESRKRNKDDLISDDFRPSKIFDFRLSGIVESRKFLPNAWP